MSKRKREEDIRELTADEKSLINKVRAFDPPLSAYVTSAFITWIKESPSSTKSTFLNQAENSNYLKPFLEIFGACGAQKNHITAITDMVSTQDHLKNIVEKKDEAIAILKICIEQNVLSSIAGMQLGRGMISGDEFARLRILCNDAEGNIDPTLLRSITGMQHGKGMPTNDDLIRSNVLMLRGNQDTTATNSSSSSSTIHAPSSPQVTDTEVPQQIRTKRKRVEEPRELTTDDLSLINKVQSFDPPLAEGITSAFITWIEGSHSSIISKLLNHVENANYLKPFLEILDACGAESKNITSIATMISTQKGPGYFFLTRIMLKEFASEPDTLSYC